MLEGQSVHICRHTNKKEGSEDPESVRALIASGLRTHVSPLVRLRNKWRRPAELPDDIILSSWSESPTTRGTSIVRWNCDQEYTRK